jgi:hypothetical protein
MFRFRGDRRGRGNLIGRFADESTIRFYLSSSDRGLRTRAALEQAARDQ